MQRYYIFFVYGYNWLVKKRTMNQNDVNILNYGGGKFVSFI